MTNDAGSEERESRPLRLVIADDHAVIRKAFEVVLQNGGLEVVGAVASGKQAIAAALELKPDIVLLDVVMPDMDGLAAVSVIRYHEPGIRIFMLTSHTERSYLSRAIELGADGFLSKGIEPETLISILRGESVEEAERSDPGMEHLQAPSQVDATFDAPLHTDSWQELTEQEALILTLLTMGYENSGIADQLSISPNTLKTHLRNIYDKLGVSSRTQAVIWAFQNGLSPMHPPEPPLN
jgi:DNA-binding NarL/FixJ family response regulator